MGLFANFDISGSAMSAQSLRLNTTASNMANSEATASSAETAYRARQPVFQAMINDLGQPGQVGVRMMGIVESQAEVARRYDPGHSMANDEGYVFVSNVNPVEEMANMISASRAYQNNVEVLNTSRDLLLRVLSLGQFITVENSAGQIVNRQDLGLQQAGLVDFQWNGLDSSGVRLPAGEYRIESQVQEGSDVSAGSMLSVVDVESVTLGKAGRDLTLTVAGLGDLSMSQIRKIL